MVWVYTGDLTCSELAIKIHKRNQILSEEWQINFHPISIRVNESTLMQAMGNRASCSSNMCVSSPKSTVSWLRKILHI